MRLSWPCLFKLFQILLNLLHVYMTISLACKFYLIFLYGLCRIPHQGHVTVQPVYTLSIYTVCISLQVHGHWRSICSCSQYVVIHAFPLSVRKWVQVDTDCFIFSLCKIPYAKGTQDYFIIVTVYAYHLFWILAVSFDIETMHTHGYEFEASWYFMWAF